MRLEGYKTDLPIHVSTKSQIVRDSLFKSSNILFYHESNRKAMNRNWSNQKANPALKTKARNK